MVIVQIDIKDIMEISCNILKREDATENEYRIAKTFEYLAIEFIKSIEEKFKFKAEKTVINVNVNPADFKKAISLLRNLADLQNGAPLVKEEKEWREVMDEIYAFLNEHESK